MDKISFNDLRKAAVDKGFKGQNPKREQLEAFLTAVQAEEDLAKVQVEAVQVEVVKPKRVVAFGDGLKARRAAVQELVTEVFEEAEKPLHWGGVVHGWENKAGMKHDHISWHDVGHAIKALHKAGFITEVQVEGNKKALFQKVQPAAEEVQADQEPTVQIEA